MTGMLEAFTKRKEQVQLGAEMAAGMESPPDLRLQRLNERYQAMGKDQFYRNFNAINSWAEKMVADGENTQAIKGIFYLRMQSRDQDDQGPNLEKEGLLIESGDFHPLYSFDPSQKGSRVKEKAQIRGAIIPPADNLFGITNGYQLNFWVGPGVDDIVGVGLRQVDDSKQGLEIYQGDLNYNGIPIIVTAAKVVDFDLMGFGGKIDVWEDEINGWANLVPDGLEDYVMDDKDIASLSQNLKVIEDKLAEFGQGKDVFVGKAAELVRKFEVADKKEKEQPQTSPEGLDNVVLKQGWPGGEEEIPEDQYRRRIDA